MDEWDDWIYFYENEDEDEDEKEEGLVFGGGGGIWVLRVGVFFLKVGLLLKKKKVWVS